jgi:starch-binding outer membrane protein, SusD/RagB family
MFKKILKMKKLNRYIAVGLIMLAVATSCKKIDDLNPHDAVDLNTGFQTISDAQKWAYGAYAALRGAAFDMPQSITDLQGGLLNITLNNNNSNVGYYRWGTFFNADDPSGYWNSYYAEISNINAALGGFPQIKTTNAADAASLQQYTGDLYLARAYYYHRLILRYAKAYNATTASKDAGVPLVLVYDVNAKPSRASVQDVYNQILADIANAEKDLANVAGAQGSNVFTLDVATALEARVRLDMQDWAGAYAAAEKVIGTGHYPLITTLSGFQNYWYSDGTQEDIFQPFYNTTNEQPSASLPYINFSTSVNNNEPFYVPTDSVLWKYDHVNDIRFNTYFANVSTYTKTTVQLYVVNKYPGNPIYNTSSVSNYQNASKPFRIAEMYLVAAEAAYNNNNSAEALTALNALHGARVTNAVPYVLAGTALRDTIRVERLRELAFEGYHLDDLERWGLGFTRNNPQNVNAMLSGSNTTLLTILPTDYHFVWAIPSNDLTQNPNLTQNPGWSN